MHIKQIMKIEIQNRIITAIKVCDGAYVDGTGFKELLDLTKQRALHFKCKALKFCLKLPSAASMGTTAAGNMGGASAAATS
jgi:hypothetical protein